MKHIKLLLIFLLLAATPGMAKIKIVQKSAKKAPVWQNTMQEDYIITSAIADDAERAKNECLNNIRKHIIDAIALNIKASSENIISQESVNDGIIHFLDKFNYSSQTQSANVPYLSGISASKIEDSYWEKREDTDTKEISYEYCVKYPFPKAELQKLIYEFEQRDEAMNKKFRELKTAYDDVQSVEQIERAVSELTPLINYFFDDVRKGNAKSLQQNYQQLYKQILIREISNDLGVYTFALALRGRDITISQKPVLKSGTLTRLRAEPAGTNWKVYYDYATCDPSEENEATIRFRVGGRALTQQFFADVTQDKVQITPCKEMYLTATRRDSLLTNIVVRMNVDCKAAKKYRIFAVTLDVPGLDKPLFIDNQNLIIEGKGMQTLLVTFYGTSIRVAEENNKLNLLKGHLEVLDAADQTHRVDFSLPFKANW